MRRWLKEAAQALGWAVVILAGMVVLAAADGLQELGARWRRWRGGGR